MHNILRIYGVSHRTFNGHKHLRVLFGSCRNTRGCRTQVENVFFFFFRSGCGRCCNGQPSPLPIFKPLWERRNAPCAARMHSRQTGRAAQMRDSAVAQTPAKHLHVHPGAVPPELLRLLPPRQLTDFGAEQNISNCTFTLSGGDTLHLLALHLQGQC